MPPKADIPALRDSGRITADALEAAVAAVQPGVTTLELDRIAEQAIRSAGAAPAFQGHQGYPATLCTSVNDQVVHGLPGDRTLQPGDVVTLDAGAKVRGWSTDAAVTMAIGEVPHRTTNLLQVAAEALTVALEYARPGCRTGDLGAAVQEYVESQGMSVVRDCSGHGIGRRLHEDPSIPNYGRRGHGPEFRPGMVVAIEPIITAGDYPVTHAPDHWTIVTADGSLAAHEETTVLITEDEPEILTPVRSALRGQIVPVRLGKVA